VRKAINGGLKRSITQKVDTLHEIMAVSYRNLGTPSFPRRYFRILKEELGDLWWYIALAYDTAERSLPDDPDTQNPVDAAAIVREMYDAAVNEDGQVQTVEPMHLMVMINQLTVLAGEGMNVIKRRIYYFSDDSDPKAAWTKFDMSRALKTLTMLTLGCGFDPREVWRVNLLKLIGPNGRYKDSFDPERAVCRNLVKEREVLENG